MCVCLEKTDLRADSKATVMGWKIFADTQTFSLSQDTDLVESVFVDDTHLTCYDML